MFNKYLNRVVVGLNLIVGLGAAILVPVANLDTSSTIGVATGVLAILAASLKFLDGWQAHEARVASDLGDGAYSTLLGQPEEPGRV